jgi:hypothetical protein
MKNKKGFIFDLIVLVIIMFLIGVFVVLFAIKEIKEMNAYKDFCKERTDFCYCDYFSCEFKTSWSSVTGFSEDTKDLCELAKSFNDTKTIFKAGCEK